MNGEIKKRRPLRMVAAFGLALVLGFSVLLAALLLHHPDPAKEELARILLMSGTNRVEAYQALHAMGPKALLGLKELVEYRDTIPRQLYRKLWTILPKFLKSHLTDPERSRNLHVCPLTCVAGPPSSRSLSVARGSVNIPISDRL